MFSIVPDGFGRANFGVNYFVHGNATVVRGSRGELLTIEIAKVGRCNEGECCNAGLRRKTRFHRRGQHLYVPDRHIVYQMAAPAAHFQSRYNTSHLARFRLLPIVSQKGGSLPGKDASRGRRTLAAFVSSHVEYILGAGCYSLRLTLTARALGCHKGVSMTQASDTSSVIGHGCQLRMRKQKRAVRGRLGECAMALRIDILFSLPTPELGDSAPWWSPGTGVTGESRWGPEPCRR